MNNPPVLKRVLCKCSCGKPLRINLGIKGYAKYLRGHYKITWSKERMQRWSNSRLGINNPNFGNKGSKNPQFGKKKDDKFKRKISIAMKGEGNPRFGIKMTPETKMKIALKALGRLHSDITKAKISQLTKRDKNPNWRGGISFEPYSAEFDKQLKQLVKDRDGNKCRNPHCRHNSKKLLVHHIDYNKQNCDPQNLITLCNSCNSRANFNRNYWQELYLIIMRGVPNDR